MDSIHSVKAKVVLQSRVLYIFLHVLACLVYVFQSWNICPIVYLF
jgi:hypothetical protein